MNITIDNEILNEALKKWGVPPQILMVIEELSELSQALCKSFRKADMNETAIIEEMADVYIMLEQLKIIFKNIYIVSEFDKQLQNNINYKLDRLKQIVYN